MAITLRDTGTLNRLENLKTEIGVKTITQVITILLNRYQFDYPDLLRRYNATKSVSDNFENSYHELKNALQTKFEADNYLKSLIK